jgi:hypothetical protein
MGAAFIGVVIAAVYVFDFHVVYFTYIGPQVIWRWVARFRAYWNYALFICCQFHAYRYSIIIDITTNKTIGSSKLSYVYLFHPFCPCLIRFSRSVPHGYAIPYTRLSSPIQVPLYSIVLFWCSLFSLYLCDLQLWCPEPPPPDRLVRVSLPSVYSCPDALFRYAGAWS